MVVNSIATLLYTMSGEKINHGAQAECVTMSASRKPFFGHIRGQICCRKAVGRKPDRLTRYRALETALYIGIEGGVKVEKRQRNGGGNTFLRGRTRIRRFCYDMYTAGNGRGNAGEGRGKGTAPEASPSGAVDLAGLFALPGTAAGPPFTRRCARPSGCR